MPLKTWRKWLACLITLALLGTMIVPGISCVFASGSGSEDVEYPEEVEMADDSDAYDSSDESKEEIPSEEESSYEDSSAEIPEIGEEPDSEEAAEISGQDYSETAETEEGMEVLDGELYEEEDEFSDFEEESQEPDVGKKAVSHMAEAFPDGEEFRTLTFENKNLTVNVMFQYKDAVPKDAELIVRRVSPEKKEYPYNLYMQALNYYEAFNLGLIDPEEEETIPYDEVLRRMEEPRYFDENVLLYDVVIVVPVKEGLLTKKVEVLPKKGLVKMVFTFKNDQLADLNVMERSDVSVMYLPFNEEIRKKYDSTTKIKNPKREEIEPEEISCKVLLYGLDDVEADEVSFVAPGASVFAIRSDKAEPLPEEEAAEPTPTEAVEEAVEPTPTEAAGEAAEPAEVTAEPTPTESLEESASAPVEVPDAIAEETPTETPSEKVQSEEEIIRPKGLNAAFSKAKLADTPETETGVDDEGAAFARLAVMKVLIDGKTGEFVQDFEWPLEGFTFHLSGRNGHVQEGAVLPEETSVTVGAADPAMSFDAIRFTKEGSYYFEIREELPEDIVNNVSDGVYYDTDTHNVTVNVVNDGGLKVSSVEYNVTDDSSDQELYVVNELLETKDAATFSVQKLQSNNGKKTSVVVTGARLYVWDIEGNDIAIDPITGEHARWQTQTAAETICLEPGHYRLVEESTPIYRHQYWKEMTPVDFVVDEGKVYLGTDEDDPSAEEIQTFVVYDDFDLAKFMADIDDGPEDDGDTDIDEPGDDDSGSDDGDDGGDDDSGDSGSESGSSDEKVYPTRAPQGADIGRHEGAVEKGVEDNGSSTKKSSSSGSSGSGSSSSGGSAHTVTVKTGGSSGSSASSTTSVTSTPTLSPTPSGTSTSKVVTIKTKPDGATPTADPDAKKADGNPNATKAAKTEDAGQKAAVLWLMLAAAALGGIFACQKKHFHV